MFERALLVLVLSPSSLSLLPFLFHCLRVLCHAHQLPQCRNRRGIKPTALTHNEEYCPVAIYNPLTGHEQVPRRLPLLRDYRNHLPGAIQRQRNGALVLVMRNSTMRSSEALSSPVFTQEREEPANLRQSYHSHEESLLPVFFLHTYKCGETRVRTKFRFVSKTEIKSRLRKRANQDSP